MTSGAIMVLTPISWSATAAAYQLCQAVEDGDRAVDRVRESAS